MKKVFTFLLALTIILTTVNVTAFAESSGESVPEADVIATEIPKESEPESTKQPESTDEPELSKEPEPTPSVIDGGLQIDSDNVHGEMQKSYKDGYIPTIKDGHVTVVLPLVGKTYDDKVNLTANLGSTTDSPFVFGNYNQTVSGESLYVFTLVIPLSANLYNGTYPINLEADYIDLNGQKSSKTFTLYVTITHGKNPPDPNEQVKEPEKEAAERPEIFIESCLIEPASIKGGEEFSVTVSVKNIGNLTAKNIKLTYTDTENLNILPTDTINLIKMDNIAPENSGTISFKLKTSNDILSGRHSFPISAEYTDYYGGIYTFTQQFSIDIEGEIKIDYDELILPKDIFSGQTITIPTAVFNTGTSTIKNVKISLSADGLTPISSVFLGDILPKSTGNGEMSVFVGTKSTSDNYGTTHGTYTISYEDENGSEKVIENTFNTNILEPEKQDGDNEDDENQEEVVPPDFQWWVSILIGFAVIAIIVSVIIVNKVLRANQMRH